MVSLLDWKSEAKRLKFDDGLSWTELTERMKPFFPESTDKQVLERVRTALRRSERYHATNKPPKSKSHFTYEKPVGVFSDPHIPFNHPNYLQFCIDTFKQHGVGQIVCCGDLVDHHAISRHQKETCAKSAYDELDMSIAEVKKFVKAFPKLRLCKGNHDDIPARQAATLGIGERYLKSFSQLLELPKTWEIEEEFIINDVLYKHGINCLGKDGALNAAITERMSTVIGHSHAFGGCKYQANKRDIIFGLNVGCGIDIAAYAFAYGKHSKNRPTLGCGIVFNESHAIFVPMGAKYFRD